METYTKLLAALMAKPAALLAAINNRAADRPNPVLNPLDGILPVRLVNSYTAEGYEDMDAPALLVPTAVDGEYPVIGGLTGPSTWKGETDKWSGAVMTTERDTRMLRTALDAARLGRGPETEQDVARTFLQQQIVRLRNAAEAAEALTAARAVTSGVFSTTRGVGVSIDLQLPNRINRTGAQNYVRNPENFWVDDEVARRKLGVVYRAVMNDVTFNAIAGASAETSGIVVEAVVANADGSQDITLSRLPKRADGTYDMSARYPDARYRNRVFKVVPTTLDSLQVAQDGTITRTREKIVEDGVIAYHRTPTLGYHHVGPTEEGGGALGRFAQVEKIRLTSSRVVVVENHVPVVEGRGDIFVLKTSLASA